MPGAFAFGGRGGAFAAPHLTVDIKADFGAVGGGADDTAAFTAFNAWAVQQTVPFTLNMPLDTYASPNNSFWTRNILDMTVEANGSTTDLNVVHYGGTFFDKVHSSRIAAVSAGSSIVTLLTPAEHTRYPVGSYVMVAGIQMQNPSGPVNPGLFEFRKISAKNTGTGVITFDTPLNRSYKTTWPFYTNPDMDHGGPATIFALDTVDRWDTTVTYNDMIIDTHQGLYGTARIVNLNRCHFLFHPPIAAGAIEYNMTDCVQESMNEMEIDKIGETANLIRHTTAARILIQSSSMNNFNVTDSDLNELIGTPRNAVIRGTSLTGDISIGPVGYGVADTVLFEDCIFGKEITNNAIGDNVDDLTYLGGGVFSITKTWGPIPWALPGVHMFYTDGGNRYNYGNAFIVLDVGDDGAGNTLIYTDAPDPLPTFTGIAPEADRFCSYSCLDVTVRNCTGTPQAIDLSTANEHRPIDEHIFRENLTGDVQERVLMRSVGWLVSIRVNVTRAYTGAQASLILNVAGSAGDVVDANHTYAGLAPRFNMKTAGQRTVTPSTVTGAQTGDILSAPGAIWITKGMRPVFNVDISGEDSSVWPIYDLEVWTNQDD